MTEQAQTLPFTDAASPDPSRLPHGEANLTPLAQLRRMQHVLYDMTQEPDIDKREAAQVACAWERLEARKGIMTMRPAPKPIDVSDRAKRKPRSHAVPVDPTAPAPKPTP